VDGEFGEVFVRVYLLGVVVHYRHFFKHFGVLFVAFFLFFLCRNDYQRHDGYRYDRGDDYRYDVIARNKIQKCFHYFPLKSQTQRPKLRLLSLMFRFRLNYTIFS